MDSYAQKMSHFLSTERGEFAEDVELVRSYMSAKWKTTPMEYVAVGLMQWAAPEGEYRYKPCPRQQQSILDDAWANYCGSPEFAPKLRSLRFLAKLTSREWRSPVYWDGNEVAHSAAVACCLPMCLSPIDEDTRYKPSYPTQADDLDTDMAAYVRLGVNLACNEKVLLASRWIHHHRNDYETDE